MVIAIMYISDREDLEHMRRTLIIAAGLPIFNDYESLMPPIESEDDLEKLQNSLLLDTLSKASVVPDADLLISCTSEDTDPSIRDMLPDSASFINGSDGNDQNSMISCINRLCETDRSIVMISTDTPTLPARCFELAFDALASDKVDVVLGPASNGGCYLAGVNSAHGYMLNKIILDDGSCTDKWIETAAENNLGWYLLPEWHRIRTSADLAHLKNELLDRWVKNPPAEHTREFLKSLVDQGIL